MKEGDEIGFKNWPKNLKTYIFTHNDAISPID